VTDNLALDYEARLPRYRRLEEEAAFILRTALDEAGVKVHGVTSRVKTLASLESKGARKGYRKPLDESSDVVGTRVVVLFLSDLPSVREILSEKFEILSTDDKVNDGDPSTFGYMSEHYVVRLGTAYQGARYDGIEDIAVEVQVRTILMDAWANVSHHLAYKGEASIPTELRRDFHALSGLFYVADQHFETFFSGVKALHSDAVTDVGQESVSADVNLETLSALLHQRYPDRTHSSRIFVSELVEEVTDLGYTDLQQLADALFKGDALLEEYEVEYPPVGSSSQGRYADVGAARTALAIADPAYAKLKYPEDPTYKKYRKRLSK
jgi:GTP pyrophosphokinase